MTPDAVQQLIQYLVEAGRISQKEATVLANQISTHENPAQELASRNLLTDFQLTALESGELKSLSIGNYLIVEKLGHGGMGVVFLAKHRRMKREVALKVLPPSLVSNFDSLQRFQREVEILAQLQHPNIAMAFDADFDNDVYYLAMEYVQGTNLLELVKEQGPLSVEQAINYLDQAAKGLSYAHRQQVIHRDVKPSNLVVDQENVVKVLDLGLARLVSKAQTKDGELTDVDLTSANSIMGTTPYMSPEQAINSKSVDARSDVYSLGCTLHFLLTGRTMFSGTGSVENILAHHNEAPPRLHQKRSDVPVELDAIFQKMVAKSPNQRFQSMDQLRSALAAAFPHSVVEDHQLRLSPGETARKHTANAQDQPVENTTIHMLRPPGALSPRTKVALLVVALIVAIGGLIWSQNGWKTQQNLLGNAGTVILPLAPNDSPAIPFEFSTDHKEITWINYGAPTVDGKYIIVTGGREDNTEGTRFPVQIYDRYGARIEFAFDDPTSWTWSGALSQDGKYLVVGTGGPHRSEDEVPVQVQNLVHPVNGDPWCYVYDLEQRKLLRVFKQHDDNVRAVCFVPHSDNVLSGGYGEYIYLWSAVKESIPLQKYPNNFGEVICLDASPDGKWFVTGHPNELVIRSVKDVSKFFPIAMEHTPLTIDFSRNGLWIAVGRRDGRVSIIDASEKRVISELSDLSGHVGPINDIVWLPESQRLLSAGEDQTIRIWSFSDRRGSCLWIKGEDPIKGIAISHDGRAAISFSARGKVKEWDLKKGLSLCP